MRTTANTRRRNTAQARTTSRHIQYATLNGWLQAALDRGQITRTGDHLDRLGIHLPDGQQSWYGRHVAKAHRDTTGTDAPRAWVQHRTTNRWIAVYVYAPDAPALVAGLWSYKATRPAAQRLYSEAA
ncbi:hypothetical protein [Kitasatospora sp. A2-31]|uniref:hypothetical protein n=1 Tax=Kitasatospora sp. A2-31 TaxID=2916414 RepID=UPI001EE82A47|nr:hypothetical protein [Kitasatospora sp. A2-31]MCG6493415.1 hypothetical protein [Kitasatospora sp. A2-31]